MSQIVDELARRQLRVGRPCSFDIGRTDTELRRLTDIGSPLQLSKGFYTFLPEDRRDANTSWLPTVEGSALGVAAALYGPEKIQAALRELDPSD